jgi:riboflavin kinase/FMN adenylyltransferase
VVEVYDGVAGIGVGRSVLTIGVFDGVHRGHAAIVGHAVGLGRRLGLRSVAVTFDPHPSEVVRPGSHPLLLSTVARRAELLGTCGLDAVVVEEFTLEYSRSDPEAFLDRLSERLQPAAIVVGSNFRYGHRAAGDVETLAAAGRQRGFAVEAVPLVGTGGGTFSSTYIRERVLAGEVATAALALGRAHRVDGTVVPGDRRGRALGYPTANVEPTGHACIPADGVYAGHLVRLTDGARWKAAVSIGTNPTFAGVQRRLEAFALDADDPDLYGAAVGVEFVERLRATEKFDSVEDLLDQMARDVAAVRALADSAGDTAS